MLFKYNQKEEISQRNLVSTEQSRCKSKKQKTPRVYAGSDAKRRGPVRRKRARFQSVANRMPSQQLMCSHRVEESFWAKKRCRRREEIERSFGAGLKQPSSRKWHCRERTSGIDGVVRLTCDENCAIMPMCHRRSVGSE